ncbi:MAG: hypothetical protein A3F26_01450 [Candidatus Ryanbacteria bacterium RIFCSPHIGHO2_12_FULL_47_12b]|uniref:Uncharacterized protein n=3 Tax=Parcubacteria group TaxID=1794811 RepID=A0A1G2H3J1_9BACT|nr:MAG: hypothetical protein UX74_C0003G0024 [Parcubacteria group bacterium GW2011_GWA2_47_10b]KKU75983.1 MAG: hypothetical protein UY02_C0037G0002 [Candidatus Giovannonibacteria bacterium GW2011_GWB1_47_6b]KKU85956.1 MAG: hypothetical protein UY14_C0010G0015 [Parcubacteria group bacterium GW2011_GWA1_47_9]OGZ46092.1 MAG: hypothetical protein A2844_00930 [Candidatus Ryanbacteria bacterium RIFCSPHIGHO2_01_FULL_48_80]OGZ49483.1 MAG: hypothetical protein A3C83_02280 [Candidatus Ryanbacteria bacter
MKKKSLILIALAAVSGAALVGFTNNAVVEGFALVTEEEKLTEIEHRYQELETRYLAIIYGNLAEDAYEAGLVAQTTPRFIKPDSLVGFLVE